MQIVHDYRYLHTIPEPDRVLPKTRQYIQNSLSALGIPVFTPAEGAVCGFLDFGKSHTLAFRADMDALPIVENTGLPWQSVHPGFMHACGHDGHCAILLELARRVWQEKFLNHNILLIFQPAEETTGGAKTLCSAGILEQFRARFVFGLHLWPGSEKGRIFSRSGVLMSHGKGVFARFYGKSAHIARWDEGADALSACCQFYCQSEALNSRDTLLKFGKLQGGTAGNVLCDRAELFGSLRTFSDCGTPCQMLAAMFDGVCAKNGCTGQLVFQDGYPAVKNDPKLLEGIQKLYPVQETVVPYFTTDDFSFYQQQIPGLYCLLGLGDTPPLHSDRFCFDEEILTVGADFFHIIATGL